MGTHSVVPEGNDDASPFRFLFLLVSDYKNVTVGSRAISVGTPGSLLHSPFNVHFRVFR
jgi:hypothetical protein